MVKAGGTKPTALGTAWATGSWVRHNDDYDENGQQSEQHAPCCLQRIYRLRRTLFSTCTGIMVTCWL